MTDDGRRRIRNTVYVLIVSFAGVFAVGFVPGQRRLFLVPLFALTITAVVLLWLAGRSAVGRLRRFSLVTGLAAVGFAAGVVYGTLGMVGFYEINDVVYLTVVIAGALGTVGGAVGCLASHS